MQVQRLLCGDGSPLLCVLREVDDHRTLLIVNLGTTNVQADPAVLGSNAGWIDLIDRDIAVDPSALRLRPLEVRILGTP